MYNFNAEYLKYSAYRTIKISCMQNNQNILHAKVRNMYEYRAHLKAEYCNILQNKCIGLFCIFLLNALPYTSWKYGVHCNWRHLCQEVHMCSQEKTLWMMIVYYHSQKRVDLYNQNGWVKRLPDTIHNQYPKYNGCARYVDENNNEVWKWQISIKPAFSV